MERFPPIFPNATAAYELPDSTRRWHGSIASIGNVLASQGGLAELDFMDRCAVQIEYMDPNEFQRFFWDGANPPCQDYRAGGLNFGVTVNSGGAIPLGMEFRVF